MTHELHNRVGTRTGLDGETTKTTGVSSPSDRRQLDPKHSVLAAEPAFYTADLFQFIKGCLNPNPYLRLTAEQAIESDFLAHNWSPKDVCHSIRSLSISGELK